MELSHPLIPVKFLKSWGSDDFFKVEYHPKKSSILHEWVIIKTKLADYINFDDCYVFKNLGYNPVLVPSTGKMKHMMVFSDFNDGKSNYIYNLTKKEYLYAFHNETYRVNFSS